MKSGFLSHWFASIKSLGRHRALSIRASIALLVTACVVPGSLMTAYLIFNDYEHQHNQLMRDTIVTARALVSILDQDLATVESGLKVLAVSPQLVSGDLAGFHHHAREALLSQRSFNYVLVDSMGHQQLNTLRPYGEALPKVVASLQAQQVFQTDSTVVTDIFIGPVSGKPTLAMAVPVHRNGKIVYALNVGISPDRVAALLQKQRLPDGWIGAALDRTGNVIARTREMERFIGKKTVPDIIKAVSKSAEGTVETLSLEGIPVITAFSRSEVSNWNVAVSIPQAVLTDQLKKSLMILILTTTTLLLGGLWIAWSHGNRIAQAFRGLIAMALDLGQGLLVNATPFRVKEADEVGQSLVAASNMLLKAQHDAYYDALTGLANRALFHQMLNQQLATCLREKSKLSVLFLDLDGFKAVNDVHGHAVGDGLLRAVANRILEGIRGSDIAARFGGDEFVILLAHSGAEIAEIVADKLVTVISAPYLLKQLEVRVSASIGIATFPDSAASGTSLLESADAAMYAAKTMGKGRAMAAPQLTAEEQTADNFADEIDDC